jgi:hypothetical protein
MRNAAAAWAPFIVFGVLLWLSSVGIGTSIAYRSVLFLAMMVWSGRVADARA